MATRRLPVIQEPSGEDAEAAARPAWHWVVIGSGLLVTIWLPTVAVALAVAKKIASLRPAPAAVAPAFAGALAAASWVLSATAAGYLVARFGQRAQRRHALLAGLLAAAEVWFLALMGGAFVSGLVAGSALFSLAALAAAFCGLGAWLARRKKSLP